MLIPFYKCTALSLGPIIIHIGMLNQDHYRLADKLMTRTRDQYPHDHSKNYPIPNVESCYHRDDEPDPNSNRGTSNSTDVVPFRRKAWKLDKLRSGSVEVGILPNLRPTVHRELFARCFYRFKFVPNLDNLLFSYLTSAHRRSRETLDP